jgi:arginyl-tRNA synthetase
MFHDKISTDLQKAVVDLGFVYPSDALLSISENVLFGDFSSNIALQLSKQKHQENYQNPREIANAILEKLGHPGYLERIEIAGPGFINFYLKDHSLAQLITANISPEATDDYATRYLVEFGHLNTHKEFHIGHLRTLSIGESLSRILAFQGHPVFKVDYGSDIGPPVAKALWGVLHKKSEYEAAKKNPSLKEKAQFLGQAYAYAHPQYEADPQIKAEIDQLNTKIYQHDPEIVPLWEETKEWSLLYFESVYLKLGTEFDARINESEVSDRGKEIVLANLDSVFIKDDGAIIFPGKQYGLNNQVYINSQGHPTYEGKELGLTQKEEEIFPFDVSLHVVDSQQTDFFKGVNKALELIEKRDKSKKKHIPYGFVSLSTGRMSSRKGNIISAEDLISQVSAEIEKNFSTKLPVESIEKIAVAAIKFFYLKYTLNSDIVYDVEKSVALHGDTGPYVLYVYARINSLLNRAKVGELEKESSEQKDEEIAQSFDSPSLTQDKDEPSAVSRQPSAENGAGVAESGQLKADSLEVAERELLRQMEYFTPMVEMAAKELQPSQITVYLIALAKAFNQFYESCPIFGGSKTEFRLALAKAAGERIKMGLYLLGIETVEKM